ncbi:MAG TPA: hypothetical protein VFZ69_10060 [Longimicrobiales bacterium]
MKTILRLLLLLPALMPAIAAAQTPEQAISRALERARSTGIPVALLESKIAEGRAKGVPMARIAAAVERRLQTLERVQAAVEPRHRLNPEELGVAADALATGVSEQVLQRIADTAPPERRAVAIAALSQLVQLGHASDEALRQVTAALQRGPEALMNLHARAAAAARRRGPPTDLPGAATPQGRGGPPPGVPGKGKPPQKPRGNPGG